MQGLLYVFFFLVGSSVGSFLNVVVYRLPRKLPFIRLGERSRCIFCKKTIETRDLIPIVSFLLLQGKCRHCKKHISLQYIIIEAFTGIVFAFCYWAFGISIELLFALLLISFSIPIFMIDAHHKVIPDALSIPFIGIAAIIGFATLPWTSVVIGAAVGGTFFFLQWFLSRGRWVGSGDIRIGFVMGFALGWQMFIESIVIAYILGTIVSVVALIARKKKFSSTIAFGPFLLVGLLVTYFWGERILDWYFTTYWYFVSPY